MGVAMERYWESAGQLPGREEALRRFKEREREEEERQDERRGREEKMEENEQDILNNKITNETFMRQQEILNKLLESEESQREQDKEEKRDSIEWIYKNKNEYFFQIKNRIINWVILMLAIRIILAHFNKIE